MTHNNYFKINLIQDGVCIGELFSTIDSVIFALKNFKGVDENIVNNIEQCANNLKVYAMPFKTNLQNRDIAFNNEFINSKKIKYLLNKLIIALSKIGIGVKVESIEVDDFRMIDESVGTNVKDDFAIEPEIIKSIQVIGYIDEKGHTVLPASEHEEDDDYWTNLYISQYGVPSNE